jgi:D-lactate dehydrogenase
MAQATVLSPPARAGQAVLTAAPELTAELERIVGADRVLTRPIDLVAFASDASFYRLIPKAVVLAATVAEVKAIFALCRRLEVPMTFRAAGTSLSGQAQTDGVLVEVGRHWRRVEVTAGGAQVRVGPGTIAARVNLALKPYGAKLGPDPASSAACTIGGILANNSSGMCCGVEQNAYRTLRSLTFVLPSGTVIDTAAPDAAQRFATAEPALATGLAELRGELLADPDLTAKIRRKHSRKNTTGYGLNSFLDYTEPLDVFTHLLVGSEGTLAFTAEAVLDTVPVLPHRATSLLIFRDLHAANEAIVPLREVGATAIELLDRASMRAVQDKRGVPAYLKELPAGAAALLVDVATTDAAALPRLQQSAEAAVAAMDLLRPAEFTLDAQRQLEFWTVRNGLFTSVGAARASGHSVLLEDVTFPIDQLADAVEELGALFVRHGYGEGVVFGHAKDGNLHFLLTQSLNESAEIQRYGAFMAELVELVLSYEGALKGEHGTGRNMAPFVGDEWGEHALDIMRRIKALADPAGILNPGVVLTDDPQTHLRNLKTTPSIEPEADRCIECGYCEHVCPSRELTLTPRQRIVVRREMLRQAGADAAGTLLQPLQADYEYAGLETCAGDGMCELACPVEINTGELVKRFRHQQHSARTERIAREVAERYATVEQAFRALLRTAHGAAKVATSRPLVAATELLRAATSADLVPKWDPTMPPAAPPLPVTASAEAAAVYLPACINRIFGPGHGESARPTLPEALVAVSSRAGLPVTIPTDVAGSCCGTPWHSKGYFEGMALMANRVIERAWRWSNQGALPIVVDATSCTSGLRTCREYLTPANAEHFDRLTFTDSIDWLHDMLLPRLEVTAKVPSVAVHAVCSAHHLSAVAKLEAIAGALAEQVVNPPEAGCCGFAGDRGWLHPELPAAALAPEVAALAGAAHADYLCSNRTCEVGLTRATGRPYRSVVFALEAATRPA